MFYGWRIVTACLVFAVVSWSLGIFGMGVYVYALTDVRGFSLTSVSSAVTLAYVSSALMMMPVGQLISRFGPQPVVATGACLIAAGAALMPQGEQIWHLYATFLLIGLGVSCLSTNTIGSTLSPWFERHQGRAMSTAMLGASIGGMVGTPLLMAGIHAYGFALTGVGAALVALIVIVPIAVFVLKARPQDIGQCPDGEAPVAAAQAPGAGAGAGAGAGGSAGAGAGASVDAGNGRLAAPPPAVIKWRAGQALASRRFQTQVIAFGIALLVQIGFLSHHVSIAVPTVGPAGAVAAVTSAAIAAFVGRLLLARFADRLDPRHIGGGVMVLAALALSGLALIPGPVSVMAMSIVYGVTTGNVTTLAPLVIRREFGAASFGVVFGMAATLNQLTMSLGPSLYGSLRDWTGSYSPALLICAALDVVAAAVLLWGGRQPLVAATATT